MLLLYLHPTIQQTELKYPYNQMVNSVFPNTIDPYHCRLMVHSFDDIQQHIHKKTFEEICIERSEFFRKKDCKLFLKYSGGTDSSLILLTMLCNWKNEDLNKVHLLMTAKSIEEFPEMLPIIKEKFKGRIHNALTDYDQYYKEGIIITGECGDQLFGSSILRNIIRHFDEPGMSYDWKIVMPKVYSQILKFDETKTRKFILTYEPTLEKCPFKIKTAFDWSWWFNYTNKVQHVVYRDLIFKMDNPHEYANKHVAFYYDLDFLRWSLDNHDKKIKNTFLTYKWPAKQLIQKYSGFTEHWYRPKVGSRIALWKNRTDLMCAINDEYQYIPIQEATKYIR
jgi:hypothetical protein